MSLSILCVTKGEPHAEALILRMSATARLTNAEFVLATDRTDRKFTVLADVPFKRINVRSQGYIESVLDEALGACSGDYVLRLDDDEQCSDAMEQWLRSLEYEEAPHWKFPRANLWGDDKHLMLTPHLWRDDQTRLSVKVKAGGRRVIHSGSPHGGGELAPVMLEHHKFLVKSIEERRAIVRRYESIQPGAGHNFLPWSVPEDFYVKALLAPVGDGTVREWADDELRSVDLRAAA